MSSLFSSSIMFLKLMVTFGTVYGDAKLPTF